MGYLEFLRIAKHKIFVNKRLYPRASVIHSKSCGEYFHKMQLKRKFSPMIIVHSLNSCLPPITSTSKGEEVTPSLITSIAPTIPRSVKV